MKKTFANLLLSYTCALSSHPLCSQSSPSPFSLPQYRMNGSPPQSTPIPRQFAETCRACIFLSQVPRTCFK
ncbi:hypothetical protein E2C01_035576 [Portunus trituberculatus]|uniref:Secreted protein n=1 Tax=Portunus trituberculatus TaxID=210409 RepID=A0A5B7F8Q4_PORTR|nr:hypothetical protein [Portunus trituberculatus]